MAKTCKKCGKRIGIFETPEVDEQGNVICKECTEKIKAEQEQVQKEKEEVEYKAKLAKALSNNPQWEYKVINLNLSPENEAELTKMGLEGWNLVSAVAINSSAAKPAENTEGEKKEEEKPEEQKQPEPLPQPPSPEEEKQATPAEGTICIFKRKL